MIFAECTDEPLRRTDPNIETCTIVAIAHGKMYPRHSYVSDVSTPFDSLHVVSLARMECKSTQTSQGTRCARYDVMLVLSKSPWAAYATPKDGKEESQRRKNKRIHLFLQNRTNTNKLIPPGKLMVIYHRSFPSWSPKFDPKTMYKYRGGRHRIR